MVGQVHGPVRTKMGRRRCLRATPIGRAPRKIGAPVSWGRKELETDSLKWAVASWWTDRLAVHIAGEIAEEVPLVEDSYHKDRIANRRLHPETLMMGYGYAPGLSEGALK